MSEGVKEDGEREMEGDGGRETIYFIFDQAGIVIFTFKLKTVLTT